jgi:hypothetical protein
MFKNYTTCRSNCFTTSGLSALQTTSEQELQTWVNYDLSNDYTDQQIPGIIDFIKTSSYQNSDTDNVKFFYSPNFITLSPRTVNLWWNNTYPSESLGHPFTQTIKLNATDRNLSPGSPLVSIANEYSNFQNLMQNTNGRNLQDVLIPTGNSFEILNTPLDITCLAVQDINTCATSYSNDGSCSSCLSPETKITLSDESTKAIKDLKAGDSIKAPYGKTAIIDEVVKLNWKELTLYTINDGILRLTPDHPVMTTEGWRAINYNARKDEKGYKRYGLNEVGVLKVGDIIVTEKGNVEITRIMPEAPVKDGTTYNLKLKDNAKSFYANGILVKSHD